MKTHSAKVLAVLDKMLRDKNVPLNHVSGLTEVRAAVADYIRDAERIRFCIERGVFPVIAADGETWCMFVAVTSARRSLFSGKNPSEAIDAALAALAGNSQGGGA